MKYLQVLEINVELPKYDAQITVKLFNYCCFASNPFLSPSMFFLYFAHVVVLTSRSHYLFLNPLLELRFKLFLNFYFSTQLRNGRWTNESDSWNG